MSRHIHQDCPGHAVSFDPVKILDLDPPWFHRGVKEAIYIRAHKPELSRDGGRFILPHIWDNSLTPLKPSGSSGVHVVVFSQICNKVMALDSCQNLDFTQYLEIELTE